MNKIILFTNVHDVFLAERVCINSDVNYQIVPIPKDLSSECGMCIELHSEDSQTITVDLSIKNIKFEVHLRNRNGI